MIEIILDGYSLDLSATKSRGGMLPVTFEVADVLNPKKPSFNGSLTIDVPHTSGNDTFFGFSHMAQSASNKPYQRFEAEYRINGIPIIQKGSGILLSSTKQGFKLKINSGNADFFKNIVGKKLVDLDFASLSSGKRWDLDTMFSARNTSSGLVCPFIDWGALEKINVADRFDVRVCFFCVYFKDIVEKIILESGFSFTGSIFSDTLYENLVLDLQNVVDEATYSKLEAEATTDVPNGFTDIAGVNTIQILHFDTITNDEFGLVEQVANSNNYRRVEYPIVGSPVQVASIDAYTQYTALYSGEYTLSYDLTYQTSTAGTIEIRVNNVVEDSYSLSSATPTAVSRSLTIDLVPGDIVYITVSNTDFQLFDRTLNVDFAANDDTESKMKFGDPISIPAMLPDMDQSEFMLTFMSMFGLMLKTDSFKKELKFFQLDTIKGNKSNAFDWSNKLQADTESIETAFSGLSQRNWLKWKYDDVVHYPSKKKGFADAFLECQDENLKNESDFFVQPFAATEDVIRYGERVAYVKRFSIDGAEIEEGENEHRLLLLDTRSFNLNFYDGTNTSASASCKVARFSQAGLVENLNFTSLKNNFHSTVQSVLQKPKIVTAKFWLTEADINQFDFEKPVYISHLGSYFYVNRINNYIPGQMTTVELIRLV